MLYHHQYLISSFFFLTAHEYEKFFDEMYEDICEDETSVVASECPVTGVSIVPSCESQTVQKSPVDSGTSSMTTHGRSSHSGSTAFSSCAASPGSVDDHKTVDKSTSKHGVPLLSTKSITLSLSLLWVCCIMVKCEVFNSHHNFIVAWMSRQNSNCVFCYSIEVVCFLKWRTCALIC